MVSLTGEGRERVTYTVNARTQWLTIANIGKYYITKLENLRLTFLKLVQFNVLDLHLRP